MKRFIRPSALACALAAVGVLAVTGLAGAAATATDHTYHGCYQSNGNVYLTGETGLPASCRNGDTAFTFDLQGPVGPTGADGLSVQQAALAVGDANCPEGGSKFTVGSTTTYACNGAQGPQGAPGANGADGLSVAPTQLAAGNANCPTGGVRLAVGKSTTYVCNGATGPQGPAGSSGAPAEDPYAGTYMLTLDGTSSGPVTLTGGCNIAAPVITQSLVSGQTFQAKHVGAVSWQPCTFDFGRNMTDAFWQALNSNLGDGATAKHGVSFDRIGGGHVVKTISCAHGYFTDLSVPSLVPGGSGSFVLGAAFLPDSCTSSSPGSSETATSILPFQDADTAASIASVTGAPASLDAFDAQLSVTQTPITVLQRHVPNLTFRYAAANDAGVSDLESWFHSFVVDGQDGQADERSATVSLDDGGVTLSFGQTGIFSLEPDARAADDAYRADVYSETLGIAIGPSGP